MAWDRFDILEAYLCLAHDYGDYATVARIRRMGFRPRPSLSTATLTENARAIYHEAVHKFDRFYR